MSQWGKKKMDLSHHPVPLYVPNLICYFRIWLSILALYYSKQWSPLTIVSIWVFASLLDLIDGIAARRLNQCSYFGILLDIVSDNILRGSIWLATIVVSGGDVWKAIIALVIMSLEWCTMLVTQLQSLQEDRHWKDAKYNNNSTPKKSNNDIPFFIIRYLFKNNFRNPLGGFAIYGSFTSGIFVYANYHREMFQWLPLFQIFLYLSYLGRLLAAYAELWLCTTYFKRIIHNKDKIHNDKN